MVLSSNKTGSDGVKDTDSYDLSQTDAKVQNKFIRNQLTRVHVVNGH